jgi:hypothetical protein
MEKDVWLRELTDLSRAAAIDMGDSLTGELERPTFEPEAWVLRGGGEA